MIATLLYGTTIFIAEQKEKKKSTKQIDTVFFISRLNSDKSKSNKSQ